MLVWAAGRTRECALLAAGPTGVLLKPVSGSLFRAVPSSAYFSAAVTLITLMALLRVRPVLQSIDIYLKGMTNMTMVAVTLLLAWALSDIGRSLGADVFISGVTEAALPVWLLPAVIFMLSAMLSFATGSSWEPCHYVSTGHSHGKPCRGANVRLYGGSALGRAVWRSQLAYI